MIGAVEDTQKKADHPKRRLRILYISQYYPPEIGATQTRAMEMATNLARLGHQVTILTEFPNHPVGIIPPSYRGRVWINERLGRIDVVRVWVFTRPAKNFVSRMLFYVSFMAMAMVRGMGLSGPYDVVYATSPPLFVGIAGMVLAIRHHAKFVFEVRDLWPKSAIDLGELRNVRFIRWAERLERLLYRRAKKIVAVTEGIQEHLKSIGIPDGKLALIVNGANTDLYRPGPRSPEVRAAWNVLDDDFVVIYTGLHGLMHGLESVLETAGILREHHRIKFILYGEGVQKPLLQERAVQDRLNNVLFFPALSETLLPAVIRSGDVGLATTKRIELCKGTLPVKMFSYMACAKPVLLAAEGEARNLVERAQAGVCVEPENPAALAEAILRLQARPDLCRELGSRGHRFVTRHYSRAELAKKLEAFLLEG